ncbi:tRNA (adenosine(37)-N6)-threonylcarbamoyltransferase complex ATPase subunit type 1 TsaE [Anaplasmataceae bacterium AB001_6]|nr:tRNA (adenosine(37)-N6)-threonylcarbamoyltransferase complex ATPase subunit type 1 TsaE [Anaplasmataceae bacterium AB001_6]
MKHEFTYDLDQIKYLGSKIGSILQIGCIIRLSGSLGVGKTALSREIIRYLCNDDKMIIISPTFNIVKTYDTSKGLLWHFDLYRITDDTELFELGITDAIHTGISIIEWSEIADRILSKYDNQIISIDLSHVSNGKRRISIEAGYEYQNIMQEIQNYFDIHRI